MRRNSTTKNFISTLFFVLIYIVYSAMCSIYLFLPPLWGVLFFYFASLFDKERYYSFIIFTILMFAIESNKGFYPGALFITYCLVYMAFYDKIHKTFKNARAFNFLYIIAVYFIYLFLYNLNAVFVGADTYFINFMILYYILCEIVIVLVARWVLDIK